ncbi:replicative DNA helicase [Paenibacillus sp. MMO-58]|uniref:replicative DNA helicase n=1 Tax=Paenibacillus sp. MMO-58 TaxID=3081290 RepID=UPI003016F6CD
MSYEAESAVLGAIIANPDLIDDCYLMPEDFAADPRHGPILEALLECYAEENAVDVVLIAKRLGAGITNLGGVGYLSQLSSSVPTVHNFTLYQGVVREAYTQRQASAYLASTAAGERIDLNEVIAKAEELQELEKRPGASHGLKKMSKVLDGHEDKIEERGKKRGMTGARTISKRLDKLTGGHQRQELVIVGARPSMGKTVYMNGDALQVAKNGYAAAIFSLEMPELQISERMVCTMAGLEFEKMRSGAFENDDWVAYTSARSQLDNLPIFIDDKPGMTIQYIRSQVKKLVKEQPNLVVYIDYLQLVSGGRRFKDTQAEVSYVSKQLKLLARECDCTVVALSQVGRQVEQRQDKRPMLSDLRDSGSIEQDADNIIFLHREEYYDPNTDQKGIVELIVAKGRNIGTFTIKMVFLRKVGKFVDIDHERKAA